MYDHNLCENYKKKVASTANNLFNNYKKQRISN